MLKFIFVSHGTGLEKTRTNILFLFHKLLTTFTAPYNFVATTNNNPSNVKL